MTAAPTKLINAREMGRHLSVSPQVILKWMRNGIIPVEVTVGHVHRFDREKVSAALAEQAKRSL